MLKKELVKIPDLNSQKKIVDKISKLSRVIEIKEQEYQNLNELIFSTYIKMFGSIKNNEKYEYVKIGDLLNKKIDKLKKIYAENSEFNYVDISSIDKENHEIVYTTKHFVGKHPSRAQQCLKSGDIVLSTVRPNLKNVAINYIDDNRVGTSGFCVLRVVESKCTKEYLMTILMSDTFTNDMVGKTTGSNYPAIKCDDIYNYLVPCPDINEKKKYSIFYENVRKQKNIIKQEISKLKEMRDKEYYYSFEC